MDAVAIFRFLADCAAHGEAAALVTITAVSGASMRNPGAHIAVAADGASLGSLSGGCIEAAVISEALAAIEEGAPRRLRYGQGSPFIDIRLPCGGSVDLLINPLSPGPLASLIASQLTARHPAKLFLPATRGEPALLSGSGRQPGWSDPSHFVVHHAPPMRLCLLGQGKTIETLAKLARTIGADIALFTPDRDHVGSLADDGFATTLLYSLTQDVLLTGDQWSAFAFFFHEHDWEIPLLARALAEPSFFVGAMGSLATHARRLEMLKEDGTARAERERIVAPIGLIPSSRDPATLALSALAQIVDRYNLVQTDPDSPMITRSSRQPLHQPTGRRVPVN